MKEKSEALEKFKEFKAEFEKESGQSIKALRADRGGEYLSDEFSSFLKSNGIRAEFTAAYTPQQNGVAERMNRKLMEAARSMMIHAGVSNEYWAEAVASAAYLLNRMVTAVFKSGETPFERWYRKKPDLRNIRVFGCMVYSHIPEGKRRKLDPKAEKLRFTGYTTTKSNYRVFDETKRKTYIRHDLVFNESDFGNEKNIEVELETEKPEETEPEVEEEPPVQEEAEQEERPVRRSERTRKPVVRYGMDEYADVALRASEIDEPTTIEEALNGSHSKQWKGATDAEYQSLMENSTWELVKLPPGRKAVGCKWVFRVKYDGAGQVERYKGRLVARGFSQKYGIDYDETFSPVARFSSIRTLLSYAVEKGMQVHQMDVVTAFLNGDLKEEIYMEQPPGYAQPGKENLVCKLQKSLYGLKQAPRCWNEKLREYLKSLGILRECCRPLCFHTTKGRPGSYYGVCGRSDHVDSNIGGDATFEREPCSSLPDERSRKTPLLSRRKYQSGREIKNHPFKPEQLSAEDLGEVWPIRSQPCVYTCRSPC